MWWSRTATGWVFDDGTYTFTITEIPGPGISLYRLHLSMPDGRRFKLYRQVRSRNNAMNIAERVHNMLTDPSAGGVDLTTEWVVSIG